MIRIGSRAAPTSPTAASSASTSCATTSRHTPTTIPTKPLRRAVEEGCRDRFGDAVPEDVQQQLDKELALIAELEVAPYFLSVQQIVHLARKRRILCQAPRQRCQTAPCASFSGSPPSIPCAATCCSSASCHLRDASRPTSTSTSSTSDAKRSSKTSTRSTVAIAPPW